MNSHQSNVNFTDLPEDIWLEIIKICEPDSLYSMYLVNKLFQQRIKNKKLLPLWICLVMEPEMFEDSWKNLESSTNNFLSHHKFLQKTKHYKLEFLTHEKFINHFNNSHQSISMINMLEIDTDIFHPLDSYPSILEQLHRFPNIKMLSLINLIISENFLGSCFKNHSLRYLSFRDAILSSFIDFSTCSFVKFSLDNANCKNGTSITMPCCLKKCDLSCCLMDVVLSSNYTVKFQMSHCKKLNTL
jgi:hypothetical protein